VLPAATLTTTSKFEYSKAISGYRRSFTPGGGSGLFQINNNKNIIIIYKSVNLPYHIDLQ